MGPRVTISSRWDQEVIASEIKHWERTRGVDCSSLLAVVRPELPQTKDPASAQVL